MAHSIPTIEMFKGDHKVIINDLLEDKKVWEDKGYKARTSNLDKAEKKLSSAEEKKAAKLAALKAKSSNK